MASITSTYTDPSDTFVWWIEGDRIAISTSKGDADTTETAEGKLKTVQLGTTVSYQSDDETANLINETFSAGDVTLTVDDVTNISVNDMLKLDSEILLVTAKPGGQTLTVTRGYRDTTDAAHVDDTQVYTVNYVSGGILISYYAEPDKLSSITGTIDVDNVLQPALIEYVKAKALMDAASREDNPQIAQIRMAAAQQALASYKESLRKFGMKKNDKVGGTRAIVPADIR
jgi:hypothetical protein|tara:strand:+ start:402 stop:1088 length:687 start_codon:yes stop_codon:yes gene_type:complete